MSGNKEQRNRYYNERDGRCQVTRQSKVTRRFQIPTKLHCALDGRGRVRLRFRRHGGAGQGRAFHDVHHPQAGS